jgi:hypothetical protein
MAPEDVEQLQVARAERGSWLPVSAPDALSEACFQHRQAR